MSPEPGAAADVVVVGGGLAGGLLALELAGRGIVTELIDPLFAVPAGGGLSAAAAPRPLATATALSYGAMASWAAPLTPMGWRIRTAPCRWRRLQRRHGPMGWGPAWFRPAGEGAPLGGRLPLPCSRVELPLLARRWPELLRGAGVRLRGERVTALEPGDAGGWRLRLEQAPTRRAPQLVLAAGAGCRALWPALPERLRVSWAGVLKLVARPGPGPGGGALRLPARFRRLAIEARAPGLREPAWVVDPGLLPWGEGWLAGQISLLPPAPDGGEPPDPDRQERRLREALVCLDEALASWPGRFLQVPVSFSPGGLPLVGPLPPPGLWLFSGFSGAFAQVPVLTPLLADWIAARHAGAAGWPPPCRSGGRLQRLGLLPDQ